MDGELALEDAQRLVRAIVDLASMAERVLPRMRGELADRLTAHLGVAELVPNTSATFDTIERANLQLALDRLRSESSSWEEIGLPADIGNYGGVSLTAMLAGWRGPGVTGRQFEAIKIDVDRTIRCLAAGIVLFHLDDHPVAVLLFRRDRHHPELVIEVAAADQDTADRALQRIEQLMAELNVLRGKVLTFGFSEYGGFGLTFASLPTVRREDVILPAWQLDAIEEHTIGISSLADELVAAGQHLKRGLLLYGPPGTGKTHTVSYLAGRMGSRTTIILSGASVGAIGQAGTLARKLAPATIVVEDVDLIGMDRGLPGGDHNPLLFQLLNEMDGLAGGDDVVFVLTTNRADLLEPALAARPGRVDQAIEIGLPGVDERSRLFRLYVGAPIGDAALRHAVARTEGAAAAFVKELARRATLRHLRHDEPLDEALVSAIDHMEDTATPLLRSSLAAAASVGAPSSVAAPSSPVPATPVPSGPATRPAAEGPASEG